MSKKLVYGVGVNDSENQTSVCKVKTVEGKRIYNRLWKCPYYERWVNMLQRCYSNEFLNRNPSYLNCIVCEEWLTFSNFITWMEQQDHEGKHLDKDLLYNGNKIYSPETCVFVDQRTNKFVLEKAGKVSPYPVGVYFEKARQKYVAECTDPFGVNGKFIGRFDTPEEAHKAWQAKKHEYACMLADLQEDERVAKALRTRYL